MHGGTPRHEKPFSAVDGRCDVAHTLQTKNPARWGSKGGANQEFSAFASSASIRPLRPGWRRTDPYGQKIKSARKPGSYLLPV
jgi:hypothetical protein